MYVYIYIYIYIHTHMHTHLFLMSVYVCVKYFFILKKPNPSQLPLFIDGKGKALRKQ